MADLRRRFIEDHAGGLLNVARQELSTAGEVLAQDGLTSEGTLFVEDGTGTKSGLKLGVNLAEVVDPSTQLGAVNVRYADRTYSKIRDLKIFSTAIASAQAALSEATTVSISNIETTLQLLEDDISTVEQNFQQSLADSQQQLQTASLTLRALSDKVDTEAVGLQSLSLRVGALELAGGAAPPSVANLTTTLNSFYYTGTIAIGADGVVTGTSTAFDTQLSVGDTFVVITGTPASTAEADTTPITKVLLNATPIHLKTTEFRVTGFDTLLPGTKMTVSPTNVVVPAGTRFKRNENFELKSKINEILTVLKSLKFVV